MLNTSSSHLFRHDLQWNAVEVECDPPCVGGSCRSPLPFLHTRLCTIGMIELMVHGFFGTSFHAIGRTALGIAAQQ